MKLSAESVKLVEAFAAKRNVAPEEAADKLIEVAVHRLNATDKYAAKQKGEKSTPVKTRAKGPLARKTRSVKA